MKHTATYNPHDNKLRLYPAHRLTQEEYEAAKALGFRWAPKQECFVKPMWTPEAEDWLLTMTDEIEDESITPEERAVHRAERFEAYSEKRANDSEKMANYADSISERFYGGQPILVGHHSEKKARKDQERMHNAMSKAVKLWETSEYWQQRAKASLNHAQYKELPDVRWRRRKGLQADARRVERAIEHYTTKNMPNNVAYQTRWLNHYNRRIEFETAMLQGWEPKKIERPKRELPPLVNFESEGCEVMTSAEWKKASRYDSFGVWCCDEEGKHIYGKNGAGRRRFRFTGFASTENGFRYVPIFISDAKVKTIETEEATSA